jgi:hypothetical protein
MAVEPSSKQSPTDSPGTVREKVERIAGMVVVVIVDEVDVVVVSLLDPIPQEASKTASPIERRVIRRFDCTTFILVRLESRQHY